jgi:hypothetical protein
MDDGNIIAHRDRDEDSWDMAYGSQTSSSTAARPWEDQQGIKPSHSRAQHNLLIIMKASSLHFINSRKSMFG